MTEPDRCPMSDLRRNACAHCTGASSETATFRWPDPPPGREEAVSAPPSSRRRPSLPVLAPLHPGATPELHDMILELTRAHSHREPYEARDGLTTWNRHHFTEVPSLVHQLLGASPAGSGEQSGATAHSRPAARIEAIDTLMLIDDEAERWLARLGDDVPGDLIDSSTDRPIPGSGTIAAIRRVGSHHRSAAHCGAGRAHYPEGGGRPDCCHRHQLEHDVRRWWHQARIISGWDSVAWRPDNTCPVCEQRRTLRVNLVSKTAMCVECRTIWTATEIGLLAEHIRGENHDEDQTALTTRSPRELEHDATVSAY